MIVPEILSHKLPQNRRPYCLNLHVFLERYLMSRTQAYKLLCNPLRNAALYCTLHIFTVHICTVRTNAIYCTVRIVIGFIVQYLVLLTVLS